ncbi:MAG: NADH-dependent [FeFe] hydrogenase, group A6 [Elusimicrobiaceae bacterium]|nr:NADH-dependent [FeFe] hydrogenase, group A6 [Elusimicrobiaceae bacterium]
MVNIEINGRKLQANSSETVLTALRREKINVPALCYMEGMESFGACRLCIVEIEGFKGLTPSCSQPVAEGMKIQTHSPRVVQARKTIIELLLASHCDDCLYCTRNGHCELANLAEEYNVSRRRFPKSRTLISTVDESSNSIVRNPEKCILCGKCIRVCERIQSVSAIDYINRGSKSVVGCAFNCKLSESACVNCGQCIKVCPTGALSEKPEIDQVAAALANPGKYVVIQHAPAVSITIAEEFGVAPGQDFCGKMVAALRRMGFKKVFDTSFSADLTIMEEASELVHRVKTGGKLPMMTSCSPAWVKFVEEFYPDMMGNLSTCKSPQQMLGAVIKSYFAQQNKIDSANIVSVSVMPCTAKKAEARRPEMSRNGVADVDYVLTTRELARLIKMFGIDLNVIEPQDNDLPFGERSTAGKLFGASGGVMEAVVRTAYHMLTGTELENLKLAPVRGLDGIKEARIKAGALDVGIAVASGLGNARKLLDEIRAGRKTDLHFIEIMSCPGGCINGGGQPLNPDMEAVKARMNALYQIDRKGELRVSHKNEQLQKLYKDYLGEPLGEKSHHLLHTHYHEAVPADTTCGCQ